jgi:hypothetical protein
MTTGNLLARSTAATFDKLRSPRACRGAGSRLRASGQEEHLTFAQNLQRSKDHEIKRSPDHQILDDSIFCKRLFFRSTLHAGSCISPQLTLQRRKKYGQASRLISTSKLKLSLALHIWPINQVIFLESLGALWLGKSHLVEGFTLRCIQRFSLPDVATRHCRWRDNRYTRGPSNPVLSY